MQEVIIIFAKEKKEIKKMTIISEAVFFLGVIILIPNAALIIMNLLILTHLKLFLRIFL